MTILYGTGASATADALPYAGQHEPVIDRQTWDAVQARLAEGAHEGKRMREGSAALLLGLVFDDRGNPMSPSYAQRGGVRYRY